MQRAGKATSAEPEADSASCKGEDRGSEQGHCTIDHLGEGKQGVRGKHCQD